MMTLPSHTCRTFHTLAIEYTYRPWPLYTLLDTSVSHRLILAEVEHTPSTEADEGERSLSEDYGIQVSGSLGNCVVSEVTEEAAAAGIQTGDRYLIHMGMHSNMIDSSHINTIKASHNTLHHCSISTLLTLLTPHTASLTTHIPTNPHSSHHALTQVAGDQWEQCGWHDTERNRHSPHKAVQIRGGGSEDSVCTSN